MTEKTKKPTNVAAFVAPTPRPRSTARELPRAPDVDEAALARAERELEVGPKPRPPAETVQAAAPEPAPTLRRRRRRTEKPPTDVIYIKGPKPVIDAFNGFKDAEGFRSAWEALEELLLAHGVQVEDFDP